MKKVTDYRVLTKVQQLKGRVIKDIVTHYGKYDHDLLLVFEDDTFARFDLEYDMDGGANIRFNTEDKPIANNSSEYYYLAYDTILSSHNPLISKKEADAYFKKEEEEEKQRRFRKYLELKLEFEGK